MSYSKCNSASIIGIATAVPKNRVSKEDLEKRFDKDIAASFASKTSFKEVRHAVPNQTASDLGFEAAFRLLEEKKVDISEIGFLVFITKTPDYRSPASALVLQHRLKLPIDCLAYDVNLGATGFATGLQLGSALLESLNTSLGLVIIADTNSKQVDIENINSYRFGDAASAILFEKKEMASPIVTQIFSFGDFYGSALVKEGAFRTTAERPQVDLSSNSSNSKNSALYFDELSFTNFGKVELPDAIKDFSENATSDLKEYTAIAIQQFGDELAGEQFFEDHKSQLLKSNFSKYGDVSGSSVALLLKDSEGVQRILAVSFGEGFSIGIADFYIEPGVVLPLIETDTYFDNGFVTHEM